MADIQRVRVNWGGFIGAPGVSTFYGQDANAMTTWLHTFFGALTTSLPADVTISFPTTGDVIDDVDGSLTGTWTGAGAAAVVGTSAVGYSAPVGALVHWLTSDIEGGHRLRGRTFLVPFSGGAFDTDGTLVSGAWGQVDTAAGTLVTSAAGSMYVWHRPRAAEAAFTDRHGVVHPAIVARSGGHASVVSHAVPDKAVVLRSRRD